MPYSMDVRVLLNLQSKIAPNSISYLLKVLGPLVKWALFFPKNIVQFLLAREKGYGSAPPFIHTLEATVNY